MTYTTYLPAVPHILLFAGPERLLRTVGMTDNHFVCSLPPDDWTYLRYFDSRQRHA